MELTPTQLIIFGASGNLARLKLIPGLYHLLRKGRLPKQFKIIGFSRREWSAEHFAQEMLASFKQLHPDEEIDTALWDQLTTHLDFVNGDFSQADAYQRLRGHIEQNDTAWNTCADKIFYLSVSGSFYTQILDSLSSNHLDTICAQTGTKVVIEKPFGHDYASAQKLNEQFCSIFKEEQIYRIDHVLGKDTLLDIISFRKNNIILREVMKNEHIDHIQVSMLESIGIGDRGNFYEENGVVRDMVQNHVLQILAIATMNLPQEHNSDALRTQRCNVLSSIQTADIKDIVIGQYSNDSHNAYRDEQDVASDSQVATFIALKTNLGHADMANVPVYIRTGKRLQSKYTEVNIVMKDGEFGKGVHPNMVTFRIQPQEGVSINLVKDKSHYDTMLENISLDFCYKEVMADAYENLLFEVIKGERSHFVGIDEVLAGWKFVDPINTVHEVDHRLDLIQYEPGSWGPKESYDLIEKDGRYWMTEHFEHVCRVN